MLIFRLKPEHFNSARVTGGWPKFKAPLYLIQGFPFQITDSEEQGLEPVALRAQASAPKQL